MAEPLIINTVPYYLTSNGGVPYSELKGSAEESFSLDGSSATRKLLVPWDRRLDAVKELLGNVIISNGYMYRTPASRYPDARGLIAKRVTTKGRDPWALNAQTGMIEYLHGCELTVQYETPDVRQEDETTQEGGESREFELGAETLEFSADIQVLSGSGFVWELDTAVPVTNTTIGKVMGQIEFQIVRRNVAYVPENTISDLNGKTNAAAFPPVPNKAGNSRSHPIDCVMFMGASTKRRILFGQDEGYEVGYKFAIRTATGETDAGAGQRITWNHVYRPDEGRWERPKTWKAPLRFLHEQGNLMRLFQPNAT